MFTDVSEHGLGTPYLNIEIGKCIATVPTVCHMLTAFRQGAPPELRRIHAVKARPPGQRGHLEEPVIDPIENCPACQRRLSVRQAVVDWVPVIGLVIASVVQSLWG
ncbi:hypothetical protein GCM10010277_68380 [Streptomyces longisporoflavus]|nr:hypothetical protein GCM10010277_68380 [Streptomyces longisporoflavus]